MNNFVTGVSNTAASTGIRGAQAAAMLHRHLTAIVQGTATATASIIEQKRWPLADRYRWPWYGRIGLLFLFASIERNGIVVGVEEENKPIIGGRN